jgi:hypothetical protein
MTVQKSTLNLNSRDTELPRCSSPEFEMKNTDDIDCKAKTVVGMFPKKVTFNKLLYVREIMHLNDYSIEEKRDAWYQKFEFDIQKEKMQETIRLMSQGYLQIDTIEHCARGLEHRTQIGAMKRRENRLKALTFVLDKQDELFDLGIFDDTIIAEIYHRLSYGCKNEAIARGKMDRVNAYGAINDVQHVPIQSFSKTKEVVKQHLHKLFKRSVQERLKN